jgi:hypothetical protein
MNSYEIKRNFFLTVAKKLQQSLVTKVAAGRIKIIDGRT